MNLPLPPQPSLQSCLASSYTSKSYSVLTSSKFAFLYVVLQSYSLTYSVANSLIITAPYSFAKKHSNTNTQKQLRRERRRHACSQSFIELHGSGMEFGWKGICIGISKHGTLIVLHRLSNTHPHTHTHNSYPCSWTRNFIASLRNIHTKSRALRYHHIRTISPSDR